VNDLTVERVFFSERGNFETSFRDGSVRYISGKLVILKAAIVREVAATESCVLRQLVIFSLQEAL
jgi:hypothetical protein